MNDDALAMLLEASKMFLFLATELSVLFLLISAAVSFLRQKISDEKIQKTLGGKNGKGYAIAAALGAVTPFCSCSTIPMLRGLLSAKAGFGPTLTFLFVSPLLNPIIVGLLWVSFGWKVTLLYTVIAAGVSVVASLWLDKWGFERYVIPASGSENTNGGDESNPAPAASCCAAEKPAASTSCCATSPAVKPLSPLRRACVEAWQQYKDILAYLALGVLIGSFIYGFVPAEWIAAHAGSDNFFAIPFAAVIGIPLYIRAEAVIPLAFVLLGKGMNMGAVMALIIGSAGASLTEVILLKSMFKTPMIGAFLAVIFGMAVLMGYLVVLIF